MRYTAFADDPAGGNPAGVVLDARGLDDAGMLAIAADLGYSETAFLFPHAPDERRLDVRYFSPRAEVPFCGHATIASAVAWAQQREPGELHLHTRSGPVEVEVRQSRGRWVATLTSVPPRIEPAAQDDVAEALAALRWSAADLDASIPPRIAYAGAHHLVLAARTRERLAALDYDFSRLGALMAARGWTTLQLVWRASAEEFHARNPFPPGGVVEDPATGAAAAAFGAYLRELKLVALPAQITIRQGDDLGRPSLLLVDIPPGDGGIRVSGSAVSLERR